ncbi:hypothetical protein [Exiguobacterium sp. S22-S28]|uniref:hypothetical protein n=1 Tax=Exiguobacterium sp. S22-S28 TaxID=3342768 RepID=UPI00372D1601
MFARNRFLGKNKQERPSSEAMLVTGKRFEANKKAILLDKEKNRYFVFSMN